tara:strand:- start:8921 stop:9631 length:711 start_codon:yes stop_codon:yes gene_type:complete
MTDIWKKLSAIDVNEHTEQKNGMTYLSWAWAWGIVKATYPNARFTKHQFEGPNGKRPYMIDEHGYAFVMVTVNIEGEEQTEVLPVLKGNKPIQGPNSFEVNTALQRCLVKALAYFGLGHYIYAGEDLPPETNDDTSPVQPESRQTLQVDAPPPAERKPGKDVATFDEKDPNRKHDEGLYLELKSYLNNAKHVNNVHQKFVELKPKLMEIKARTPHRAEMIFELFSEAEDRLSKGDS